MEFLKKPVTGVYDMIFNVYRRKQWHRFHTRVRTKYTIFLIDDPDGKICETISQSWCANRDNNYPEKFKTNHGKIVLFMCDILDITYTAEPTYITKEKIYNDRSRKNQV